MEEEDATAYLKQIESQRDDAINKMNQSSGVANSMFAGNQDPNLIEWQLELDNILERNEHLLRGDVLVQDKEGNIRWESPKDDALAPLNEFGVQLLMNILSSYVNRNTILSNYSDQRIKDILFDLGNEIIDQIYLHSEEMGLNTPSKRKRYPMLALQLIHTIESSYNRAFMGEERESLRSARVVTQSENLGNQPVLPGGSRSKEFKLFSPSTWMK